MRDGVQPICLGEGEGVREQLRGHLHLIAAEANADHAEARVVEAGADRGERRRDVDFVMKPRPHRRRNEHFGIAHTLRDRVARVVVGKRVVVLGGAQRLRDVAEEQQELAKIREAVGILEGHASALPEIDPVLGSQLTEACRRERALQVTVELDLGQRAQIERHPGVLLLCDLLSLPVRLGYTTWSEQSRGGRLRNRAHETPRRAMQMTRSSCVATVRDEGGETVPGPLDGLPPGPYHCSCPSRGGAVR